MRRETAQLYVQPGADIVALTQALRTVPGCWAPNLPGCFGAGDYTWDLPADEHPSPAAIVAQLQALPGIVRVDRVCYEAIAGGVRAPGLTNGIKRTLFLRVKPDASSPAIAALEHDLLRLPRYMPGIRNWSLGRVVSDSPWSHVWQQEFARVDDLLGEYMVHPYHWAWVDRWFDPEFPQQIVDTTLCHAFCPIETSVLAWADSAPEVTRNFP